MTEAIEWLFTPLPPAAAFIAYAALGYMVGLARARRRWHGSIPEA